MVESFGYPNDVPGEPGTGADKIKILEDTDGDGKADKMTVFAEGLRHCTATVFVMDGVIATDGCDLVHLRDDNGDRDHGRIWHIVPAKSPLRKATGLDLAKPATLEVGLTSPSQHIRLHAQRLLVERGVQDVVKVLNPISLTLPSQRRRR